MKVRIACYKHTKKMGNFMISAWTWLPNMNTPPYSHIEIGVERENGWEYFSSTNRGGASGTRWAVEGKVLRNRERWDVYEIEVTEEHAMQIIDRANSIIPADYDWQGIYGFVVPFGLLNDLDKWYCSEAVYFVLFGIWKKKVSPRKCYKLIRRKYKDTIRRIENVKISEEDIQGRQSNTES